MDRKKIVVEANANFHYIHKSRQIDRNDARFIEYRKKWKEWPENFHVGEFPLFIDIEVTSVCNLRCPFCATTFKGKKIKKGFISFDTIKKIVDEGAQSGLYGIKFNIRGEPLLHPQICDFIEYAKKKKLIDVYFNTNAMPLTEDISKKLIDAGLDRISISFEGYTKEVYEKNRVGAVYETVLSNIETLQELKKKSGVEHPVVRIQTVMVQDVKDDMEGYKKFWRSRADEVAFLDYKEMKYKKKAMQYPWACPQIWQRMAVWWDGTILLCNHDDDGLLASGNIGETSIKETWHSEKLNGIRDKHKKGMAHEIKACDGCYLRDSEVLKLMEKEKKS